jgi:hypothetical protein
MLKKAKRTQASFLGVHYCYAYFYLCMLPYKHIKPNWLYLDGGGANLTNLKQMPLMA